MFGCTGLLVSALLSAASALVGPEIITTCESFEQEAYFNPYEILDSMWKIFYFWANNTEVYPIMFSLPSKQRMNKIMALVQAVDPELEIPWQKAVLLMEPRPGVMVILLHAITPGAFRALVKVEQRTEVRPHPLPLIKFADVRMKMVGRYIGMMCCEELTAYAMVRVDEMPTTEEACVKEALKLGISLPNGRSYLYLKKLADEL